MERSADLMGLRLALLLQPEDAQHWQALIALIEALGAGLLLADLDGLFEQPLPRAAGVDRSRALLQQALEAHRAGDRPGLRQAWQELRREEPDAGWCHALQGLLAELEGASGYAAFARALALEPEDPWFRYWLSVAALRRRDWLDFACQALLLAASPTLEHQLLVLAAVYHLTAAALVRLAPDLCQANDLRVFDLVHPDTIPHSGEALVPLLLRFVDKERRKMVRILMAELQRQAAATTAPAPPLDGLVELLRWRILGLPEPGFSADLHAALQRQLGRLPLERRTQTDLQALVPQRPDLAFAQEHIRIWRDFRFTLPVAH